MLAKPSNWDTLRNQEGTVCTYKVIIGQDVYTSLNDIEDNSLKITRTLFTSSNLIGNTPCFTLECCLRLAGRTIPRGATVLAQVALKNGNTTTSFVPLGTFKVYRRQKFSDDWVKLTCRDKMQMANQSFFKNDVVEDSWPKPMITVLRDSAAQVGVEIDPRTAINEGDDWIVTPPAGQSIRSVWSAIAAAHAGNFYITPEDKLLLVVPKTNSRSPFELECSEDGYEILGEGVEVNRVTLKINSEVGFSSGTSGINDIEVDCPYANQTIVDYVKSVLTGVLYYPIKVSDLWIDPVMELHDSCRILGSSPILTTWSSLDTSYRLICSAEGAAETMMEPASEYGFEDTPLNQLKTSSKTIVKEALSGLNQEDILNILTDNGKAQGIYVHEGQLLINASYVKSGSLSADLIKAGILQSADGKTFFLDLDKGILEMEATRFLVSGKTVEEFVTSSVEESTSSIAGTVDLNSVEISTTKESVSSLSFAAGEIAASVSALETTTTKSLEDTNSKVTSLYKEVAAKVSPEDVSLQIQTAMENGTDRVVTKTGFTFNENGLHVEKSGSEMRTQITENGMTVYQNNEAVLTANNQGVDAKNLHATTYLIVGGRSRFENYGSDRTGCFWIGE